MAEPRVLGRELAKRTHSRSKPDTNTAWKWIGWFGLVIAVVGLWDFALAWYPTHWGTPAWEFATITSSYSGLPLPTMGIIALTASAIARGVRWQVLLFSIGLILFAAALLLGFVLFVTTLPVAFSTAEDGVVAWWLKKAIARTAMLAVAFSGSYLVAGIMGFRHLYRTRSRA